MMYELRDIGFSTAVGIGGDPVIGTTHIDCLAAFEADPETDAIVMIGEIGGDAEERAAAYIKDNVSKPVVGYVAGFTAPEGKTMGHAGAIVSGSSGTARAKQDALEAVGVKVGRTPSATAQLMREIMTRPLDRRTAKIVCDCLRPRVRGAVLDVADQLRARSRAVCSWSPDQAQLSGLPLGVSSAAQVSTTTDVAGPRGGDLVVAGLGRRRRGEVAGHVHAVRDLRHRLGRPDLEGAFARGRLGAEGQVGAGLVQRDLRLLGRVVAQHHLEDAERGRRPGRSGSRTAAWRPTWSGGSGTRRAVP